MSDPDYKLCDVCGGQLDASGRLHLPVGTSPDPAGGSSETDYERLDLCDRHKAVLLTWLVCGAGSRGNDYDLSKKILQWAKDSKNRKA